MVSFLSNPLAWYKRYVEGIYDTPSSPASVIGRAGHVALQHFYGGIDKIGAIDLGLEYLRDVPDFEINFGKARSRAAQRKKRLQMEREYLQAINFYLKRPPRHKVLGIEVKATVDIPGFALPLKAVSDLVVESRVDKNAVDIVDHKFVAAFSSLGKDKTLFLMQALFNYYTVQKEFQKEVRRFIFIECKKTKNANGVAQLRRHIIDFKDYTDEFSVFQRLINDATSELKRKKVFLPNPLDMFEGEESFAVYRMGLLDD